MYKNLEPLDLIGFVSDLGYCSDPETFYGVAVGWAVDFNPWQKMTGVRVILGGWDVNSTKVKVEVAASCIWSGPGVGPALCSIDQVSRAQDIDIIDGQARTYHQS